MEDRLGKDFYKQDAITAAQQLIGKYIVMKTDNEIKKYQITETEAYYGFLDTACHAHKGKTQRNENMFCEGGILYIYLCYGIHQMLNIVTGDKDHPEAVLLRGITGFNGPGKLTKHLSITKELNGLNLIDSDFLWIEDLEEEAEYTSHKRVGIDYATDEYKNKEWRFKIE